MLSSLFLSCPEVVLWQALVIQEMPLSLGRIALLSRHPNYYNNHASIGEKKLLSHQNTLLFFCFLAGPKPDGEC